MGGVTSSFRNNSELVDNLVSSRFIRSKKVERIFRATDRGFYFPTEERVNAYRDLAWSSAIIHLSSPCIYAQVMEHLKLSAGLSFLNLGSGTGYFSTMVGLLLGRKGINHGVEVVEELVQYAYEKLEEFENTSRALDEFEFCRPTFVCGNYFCLSENFPQYDRVYCGAGCQNAYIDYMKNLVKVNGVLIMVCDGILTSYTRTSEDTWKTKNLRSFYFASFIAPGTDEVQMITSDPMPLQYICRESIRTNLRNAIKKEFADEIEKDSISYDSQRKRRRVLAPISEGSYLETIDNRNESYLMSLLDEFRNEYNARRDPDSIINNLFPNVPASNDASSNEALDIDNPPPTSASSPPSSYSSASPSPSLSSSSSSSGTSFTNKRNSRTRNVDVDIDTTLETFVRVSPVAPRGPDFKQVTQYFWNTEPNYDDSDDEQVPVSNDSTSNPVASSHENMIDTAAFQDAQDNETDVSSDDDVDLILNDLHVDDEYKSPYTPLMQAKIQALPLPAKLKRYLNMNRDFD